MSTGKLGNRATRDESRSQTQAKSGRHGGRLARTGGEDNPARLAGYLARSLSHAGGRVAAGHDVLATFAPTCATIHLGRRRLRHEESEPAYAGGLWSTWFNRFRCRNIIRWSIRPSGSSSRRGSLILWATTSTTCSCTPSARCFWRGGCCCGLLFPGPGWGRRCLPSPGGGRVRGLGHGKKERPVGGPGSGLDVVLSSFGRSKSSLAARRSIAGSGSITSWHLQLFVGAC